VTRDEAVEMLKRQRDVANLVDADSLWLSLKAKEGDLYARLMSVVITIKPKKRRRLEQELHSTRVLLALLRANFPVVRTILEHK
jgi:hypothetical protein